MTTVNAGGEVIETVRSYDGLGRVFEECNPRKQGLASDTDGCYTHAYDALGRLTIRTGPDNSQFSYSYSTQTDAAVTTIEDETDKRLQLHHDGLGRLIRVVRIDRRE